MKKQTQRLHTILYYGNYVRNYKRLKRYRNRFAILTIEGKEKTVAKASKRANGIIFGYMEKPGKVFVAVKVENVVLDNPIVIMPRQHTDNKGFGPSDSLFSDQSAKRLLIDVIKNNPTQELPLRAIYEKHFGELKIKSSDFHLPEEIDESPNYYEGTKKRITVNAYERDPEARRKCILHYGTKCYVCGFDFGKKYGKIGVGYIHVHHEKPLSEIGEEYQVDPINDMKPVCPNCHAMIHAPRGSPLTPAQLKKRLRPIKDKRLGLGSEL